MIACHIALLYADLSLKTDGDSIVILSKVAGPSEVVSVNMPLESPLCLKYSLSLAISTMDCYRGDGWQAYI